MATIVTKNTGATAVNRPLTTTELDNNFINLNNALANISLSTTLTGDVTGSGTGSVATTIAKSLQDVVGRTSFSTTGTVTYNNTETPFAGSGNAFYLNNGYITPSQVTATQVGTGNFTLEFFWKPLSDTQYKILFQFSGDSQALRVLAWNNQQVGLILKYQSDDYTAGGMEQGGANGAPFVTNTWNHVVLVRSGNYIYLGINGIIYTVIALYTPGIDLGYLETFGTGGDSWGGAGLNVTSSYFYNVRLTKSAKYITPLQWNTTYTVPQYPLAGGSFMLDVTPTGLGGFVQNIDLNSISLTLANVTAAGSTTTTPTVFNGGLSSKFIQSQYKISAPSNLIYQGTGSLTQITSDISTTNSPNGIAIDPTGRFLYAAIYTGNVIRQYSINQNTGVLTQIATIATGTNPRGIVVDPTGRFVYVANYTASTIGQYSINQTTGELTLIGTSGSSGGNLWGIAVDPTGKFLYVTNSASHEIRAYLIDQTTGALSSIDLYGSLGTSPRGIAVHPTGKFLYVANYTNGKIGYFLINQDTGKLTEISTNFVTSSNPYTVVIDPSGRFLYAPTYNTNTISQYSINATTGALSEIGIPADTGNNPRDIVIDSVGKFLYAINFTDNTIWQYLINQLTGQLTTVATNFTGITGAYYITVDPTNRFIYVSNAGSNSISQYFINNFSSGSATVAGNLSVSGSITGIINGTVDGTNSVGYLNIPQNSQSAAYTTVLSDAGKHIYHPSADISARTYTIAANASVAYPIGTVIGFVNMSNQAVTIAINTDTMYLGNTGATGSRTLGIYGVANALKITATSWIITGTALT